MIDLDRRAERWVVEHRAGALDQVFVWISRIGAFGWVFLAVALVAAVAVRRPQILLLTLSAAVVSDLLTTGMKDAIGRARPRPAPGVPHPLVALPSDPSFPSGHTAVSFACAVVLSFALPRLAVPLLLLATAIAYSRVYLGVHYPLDVLGAALLGAAVATALRWLAGVLMRSRRAQKTG